MAEDAKVILLFIDGLGITEKLETNPLSRAPMPTLQKLIGGPLISNRIGYYSKTLFHTLDACLGQSGLPQSATGQSALFTGKNAAQMLGYHLPAFPNPPLINLIRQFSVFKQFKERGLKSCFANAYRSEYLRNTDESQLSVTTHCVLAAGLPFLLIDDLLAHRAVYCDITNQQLHNNYEQNIPVVSAYRAGTTLASIAQDYHLTVFECFDSDFIGHRRNQEEAFEFLQKLDTFLSGILDHRSANMTVVLTSDHGNLEDLQHGYHTYNPVPLLAIGERAAHFCEAKSLTDIVPLLLSVFDP